MNLKDYEPKESLGFFKPQPGANKIRIVSEIQDFGAHFSKRFNKSFICSGTSDCIFCKDPKEEKPKLRYLCWIIDRADGEIKLYEFGHSVFKQLVSLAKDPDYAFEFTPDYDITINKTGNGMDTEYAVVAARTNSELTNEEKLAIDEKDSITDVLLKRAENLKDIETEYSPGFQEQLDAIEVETAED